MVVCGGHGGVDAYGSLLGAEYDDRERLSTSGAFRSRVRRQMRLEMGKRETRAQEHRSTGARVHGGDEGATRERKRRERGERGVLNGTRWMGNI